MIAKIEFKLPDETKEHRMFLAAPDYIAVLRNMDNWLRDLMKYKNRDTVAVEDVRDKLLATLEAHDVSIW